MERKVILATCSLNQWALDFEGNMERILKSKLDCYGLCLNFNGFTNFLCSSALTKAIHNHSILKIFPATVSLVEIYYKYSPCSFWFESYINVAD